MPKLELPMDIDLGRAYTLLNQKKGRRESLRSVQLDMLGQPRFSHPFYWAAFTLSGNWTPIQ